MVGRLRAVVMAGGIAKIPHETEERWLSINRIAWPSGGIPVVIAGNGKNGGVVALIGFIELTCIEIALPVEIDDISEVVVKSGSGILVCSARNLIIHRIRDCLFYVVTVDASGVADRVKDQHSRIFSRLYFLGEDHI